MKSKLILCLALVLSGIWLGCSAVAHPFHIVKNLFRHRKVRYRGLAKNRQQLYRLFGLASVVIGSRTATT